MLRYKINGAILITFAAIAFVFMLIQRPVQQQRLQTVMGKAKSILYTLAVRDIDPLANAIVDNRVRDIRIQVKQMLGIEGIMAISVFDDAGALLHSDGDYPQEASLPVDEQESIHNGSSIRQERRHGVQRLVYLQEIRVIGERYGFLRMCYSLADVEAEQRQAFVTFGILLGSILLVMLVLLNLILSKTIIQPVTALRDAMQHLQTGELGKQVQVTTGDEIGDLTETFNAMSLQLYQNQQAQCERELAEASNHAKSEFLKTLNHEIRTPLSAIIGLSELARQTSDSDTLRTYVERIAGAGKILNALVNEVLDLSSIEAGKFSLISDTFNIHHMLNTAIKPFQFGSAHEAISWNVSIDRAIPLQLYGDSTRVTQVLVNLISNAVKFTRKGTISVSVELQETPPACVESWHDVEGSLWLHFSVKDTGIGIPEQEQAFIFQEFFQGDSAIRLRLRGTGGIGMAIVKKIVEAMHGRIWLSSRPGVGTHVHVLLPFRKEMKEKVPEPSTQIFQRGERILVAEDNSSNRFMLKSWLSHAGFRAVVVENGEAAIEQWQQEKFDVILMDKQMPIMDGLQATQKIRKLEKQKGGHTHIIALTAAATTDDRTQCLEAGMDGYLSKPVDMAALLQTLNAFSIARIAKPEELVEKPQSRFKPDTTLFDLDKMPKSWKHNPAKQEKFIALLIEDIQQSLYRLEQAIHQGDLTALSKAAHKLKGAIGKVRAETIQELVSQLEMMRRQGDLEEASNKLTVMKCELERVLGIPLRDDERQGNTV